MADWCEKATPGDSVDIAALRFGPSESLTFEGQQWTFNQLQEDIDRADRG